MNNINFHQQLYQVLDSFNKFRITNSYIEVEKNASSLEKIVDIGLEVEKLHNHDRILIPQNIKIYDSITSFLSNSKIKKEDNILIIEGENTFSFVENKSYIKFNEKLDYFLFTNSFTFLCFLDFLKSLENEIDGSFHFIDSYNRDVRKLTLVSIAEKSRLIITYLNTIPHFDVSVDLRSGYDKFVKCFEIENKNLPRFLKTATINAVTAYSDPNKIQQFFENLDTIVYKAKVNFEVYLSELSIDKVRKDYDEVKTKYFSSLSDTLAKLTTSILALPIAIATLLFSIEKLKDNSFYIVSILFIVIITSAFISLLLKVNLKDLLFTKKLLDSDYKKLIENNFFTKYSEEKNIFEDVKIRISERIKFLKAIVESYFWIMNIFNLFIVGLALHHLDCSFLIISIVTLILFIALSFFRSYVFEKEENV